MRDIDEIETWLNSQDWYQIIELSNGLVTNGKVSVNNRLKYFGDLSLSGNSFLDIGCNSGGYCLWAKKNGASRVFGYDIDTKRLAQANTLKEIENLDVEFINKNIFDIDTKDNFDVVFCISVLTEITDIFGALHIIKNITRKVAYVEMALSRPVFYWSSSTRWLKGYKTIRRQKAIMELVESKRGYMIAPSLEIVQSFFGNEFSIEELGKGERYDLLKIERI